MEMVGAIVPLRLKEPPKEQTAAQGQGKSRLIRLLADVAHNPTNNDNNHYDDSTFQTVVESPCYR